MSNTPKPEAGSGEATIYQIRLKGHLGPQWSGWFEGMDLARQANGDTIMTGPVVDQAALHGLLKRMRDLGLPLLSIVQVEPKLEEIPETGTQDLASTVNANHRKETS
jgi:hypothetical protein